MRNKRRKSLARQWAEFQKQYQLSDEVLALARKPGYPLDAVKDKLEKMAKSLPISRKIRRMHDIWEKKRNKRKAAIESGEIKPKPKNSKKKKAGHDPAWAKAKTVCRLNAEDIRMAKELGIGPKSQIKNRPSPSQQWKAPVKEWIRDLYEERKRKMAQKAEKRKKESS